MAVDLNELLVGEQAAGVRAHSAMNTNFLGLMDRVFLREVTEPSMMEAAAVKEIAKSGTGTDLASINAGHNTPNPNSK